MRVLAASSGLAVVATSATLISSPAQAADPVDVQIIGTNDFHGRLLPGTDIPGAAKYAGAVEQFRADNPNTIFAAAGDLIGATTFESFIQNDKPTIDVFNEMDLDVSAVGNHELDQGYDDLVDRVMAPYDATTNPEGGAEWAYVAANIDEPGDADEIAPSWTTDVGGVTVGFVGAVTEDLPSLVPPTRIAGLEVTDIVAATNEEAAELRADGADLVVLLVHEGAPGTDCAAMDDDPTSDFGSIITGVSGDVDAIVSGHTHLNYSCSFPVAAWADRPVKERLVVSAGQYGNFLNKMSFSVDPDTGDVLAATNENLNIATGTYPADAAVQAIVDQAKDDAAAPGAVELGTIEGAFKRASRPKADGSGAEENRGGESTLGNLVAEAQRWAAGGDLGFMNPGGLRADMVGKAEAGYPAAVTYKQAADVQPFANTLVNVQLTGAQIKSVLEEQWQPEGASRPFLRLGTSKGFTYTYDPAAKTISGMWLNGKAIDLGKTYTVTANSFLAGGGDNFAAFKEGAKRDTGQTDLQAMVEYLGEFASGKALPVDARQHAVGLVWRTDRVVEPRSRGLRVAVSSWSFSGDGDVQDSKIVVRLGKKKLGSFAVDNSFAPAGDPLLAFDELGTALVNVKPSLGKTKAGKQTLVLTGNKTGTTVEVPVRVKRKK